MEDTLIGLFPTGDFEKRLFLEKYVSVLKEDNAKLRQKVGMLEGEVQELMETKDVDGKLRRTKDTLGVLTGKHVRLKKDYNDLLDRVIKMQIENKNK